MLKQINKSLLLLALCRAKENTEDNLNIRSQYVKEVDNVKIGRNIVYSKGQ